MQELQNEIIEVKIFEKVILMADFKFNLNIFNLENAQTHNESPIGSVRIIEQVHGTAFALSSLYLIATVEQTKIKVFLRIDVLNEALSEIEPLKVIIPSPSYTLSSLVISSDEL